MKLCVIAGIFCWLAAIVRGDNEVCSNNGCVSFEKPLKKMSRKMSGGSLFF